MPELPEVETTLRGIAPHLQGGRIAALMVRQRRLRYPIAAGTEEAVAGQPILAVRRRGKYLLVDLGRGGLLIHLGMSGSLRVLSTPCPPGAHDHLDLCLEGGARLRLHDPRRFGGFLWTPGAPDDHPLIRNLGPEPLGPDFDGACLHRASRGRRTAVKAFIMDGRRVAGVGNIYANESLFLAGIHPGRASGRVSAARYQRLAESIRTVLRRAIREGGTSLRDFVREDGQPGYFARDLQVYGRDGLPCLRCGGTIRQRRIGQRSSFFCVRCQR
jgi:formamidopyrimidine-DNA glycosylase